MADQLTMDYLIKQVLENHRKVIQLLEDNSIDERHDDSILLAYFTKISKDLLFINSAISKKVADYCQLLNEENNFERVSLDQIKEIYRGCIQIHPLDIGFYESLAFYLNNVLDEPEEARLVLTSGIDKIERKIDELKRAMKKI